jgi:hypothetical protein
MPVYVNNGGNHVKMKLNNTVLEVRPPEIG